MAGPVLTMESRIQCPHGGQAILVTSDERVMAASPALIETDVHAVIGCPFVAGTVYMPCVTIEWSAGATRVQAMAEAVLTQASIGKCLNASRAPQGLAVVVSTQHAVSAT
jgi:hypothetical protein